MTETVSTMARHAAEDAADAARDVITELQTRRRKARRARRNEARLHAVSERAADLAGAGRSRRGMWIALGVLGAVTIAVVVANQWRRDTDRREIRLVDEGTEGVPDPFGRAVAKERASSDGGTRPVATPGA